jgi:hypothetical protein
MALSVCRFSARADRQHIDATGSVIAAVHDMVEKPMQPDIPRPPDPIDRPPPDIKPVPPPDIPPPAGPPDIAVPRPDKGLAT